MGDPVAAREVRYHVPRNRRRWPVVTTGVLALGVLVAGQVAVAPPQGVGPDRGPVEAAAPLTAGPTGVPSASSAPTTVAAAPGTAAAPPLAAVAADAEPVPETTVVFSVGAVLDQEATDALQPVLDVLLSPGAAPALVHGTAEPGPDPDVSSALATARADAVVAALVERGVPASLLRVSAEVDAAGGRAVVVAPDVP